MHTSTLSQRGQASIPSAVRKGLSLKKGDKIIFEHLDDGRYAISKLPLVDRGWTDLLASSFHDELSSKEDDEFFAYLKEK